MDSNKIHISHAIELDAFKAFGETSNKPINSTSSSCPCAKGYVYQLSASAIQKTQTNSATKNCFYVMDIRRSDGTCYRINRTYGDIVCLNNSLPQVKQLIMEKKLKKNDIPKLPDRIERTKDLPKLNRYFDALLQLQEGNNLLSKALGNFCRQDNSCDACRMEEYIQLTSPEKALALKTKGSQDLKHISSPLNLASGRIILNYKSDDKRQLSLMQNSIVKILRKCPTGWWFVICGDRSGWFPASYIELFDKTDSNEITFMQTPANYKADQDYNARNDDELSFRKNDSVVVKQKHMDGWWLAEINGREGYVPATYLRPSEKTASDGDHFIMCCETMNMDPASRRPCLENITKSTQQISVSGFDLVPEEEIIKDEKVNRLCQAEETPICMTSVANNSNEKQERSTLSAKKSIDTMEMKDKTKL